MKTIHFKIFLTFLFCLLLPSFLFANPNLQGVWESIDAQWEETITLYSDGTGKWTMPMDLDGTFFSWKASGPQELSFKWSPQETTYYEYIITKKNILVLYMDTADGPMVMLFKKIK